MFITIKYDICIHSYILPLRNAESWIQYLKWSKIQNDSYIVGINLEPEQIEKEESFFNIINYEDAENDNKEEEEDIQYHKHCEFNYKKLSLDIFEKYEHFSFEPDDEYRFIHKVNEKYCGISMQVRCKKDFYNDHWKIKISFIINHEPLTVYNFLRMSYIDKNDIIRNGWDKKLIDKKIVTKLDTNNFICHEIYKSFNSPYKFRDFVVLRSFKKQELGNEYMSKRYFIICSSITKYKKIPEATDKLRCIIYPSGFEIRPYNNISKITCFI